MFKNTTVFSNLKYVKSVLMDTLNETKSLSYFYLESHMKEDRSK